MAKKKKMKLQDFSISVEDDTCLQRAEQLLDRIRAALQSEGLPFGDWAVRTDYVHCGHPTFDPESGFCLSDECGTPTIAGYGIERITGFGRDHELDDEKEVAQETLEEWLAEQE